MRWPAAARPIADRQVACASDNRAPARRNVPTVAEFGYKDFAVGFDEHGLMRLRIASINDLSIKQSKRKYHWPLGRRPDDHASLSDLRTLGLDGCGLTNYDIRQSSRKPQPRAAGRFGSKADILGGLRDVRFTLESGHWNSTA
jgi:hypothetical protein